jgi:WS/DGAT/MGAT family acyltransferase
MVVPAPGDLQALLDLAAPIAMAAFDKDRPLWEFTLVEGLEDGQAALIQKVHHAFTDGVGGIKLAQLVLDERRHPAVMPVHENATDDAAVSPLTSAIESMAHDVRAAGRLTLRSARSLPGLTTAMMTHPTEMVGAGIRGVKSIGKLLAPVTTPLSPVMTGRSLSRRLGAFDVPFEAMHGAAHAADSTVNDAFLASVTGGLRRYHRFHDHAPEALRVTMPINLRSTGDGLGNNKFVPARLAIPINEPDPVERMHQLGALARSWRKEPALPLTEVIAGALNRLPVQATTSIFGSMLKAIDFVATNVPGIPRRAYLAGAEVVREYAFAPPSGAAFSIALLSHHDQCCIGVNMDSAAVPDPEELMRCLREGFDEVVAVGEQAGAHEGARS